MAKKKIELADRKGGSAYSGDLKLEPDFFDTIPENPGEYGIVKRDDGALIINSIVATQTGLQFTSEVGEDEWVTYGEYIIQLQSAYQWIVGDYLAYGSEKKYGKATEFAELLGKSAQTVWNWVAVAKSVKYSRRREVLSFGHHETVASLSAEEQEMWLEQAVIGNGKEEDAHKMWSVKKLRDELAKAQGLSLPETTSEPVYQRWAAQSDIRIATALAQYRKQTDQRKRNAWKQYIEAEAHRWQQALEIMNDE